MEAQAFLDSLTADPAEADNLVHVEDLPARDPKPLPFPDDLPEVLVSRLSLLGVEGLFEHQRLGLEALRGGRNVMLATGTASGKSLVYQIATAESALVTPKATALFLFPTKALARDQLRAMRAFKLPQVRAAAYDGDTPQAERPLIRRNANLVLTNPDMLHLALLADNARWADFMLRLSVVVVDEAHVLRGVFGSHVAMTLRRLRRLIAHHGGNPRWCLASATVGNPSELAERLTGLDVDVIEADAAPRGRKLFAMWNPPIIDDETGARRSALAEASTVMTKLVDDGARTIGFTRSRRAAELLAEFTRRGVSDAQARDRIRAYRAGYLAEDRRKIEQELADGDLVAVAATNALELGIDIGSLDAAVLTGYPGTRASMWQQAGRAGRRRDESLAVLVAQDDPLDQYLAQHPDELFERPSEAAVIDPTNPYVLEPHLRCAAREFPLTDEEATTFFGPKAIDALERLAEQELVKHRKERWHDIGSTPPHRDLDIRAGGGRVYRIVQEDTGQMIGTADEHRAYGTLHPGAIYLHQGEQFLVRALDHVRRVALVEESDPDYYTQARDITDIVIVNVIDQRPLGDAELCFGDVEVTNQVVGFVRKLVSTNELIGQEELALPPVTLRTRAVWWTLPGRLIDRAGVGTKELAGGIHGAEHCAIGLLPLVATCDRWDIGGVSTPLHPDTGLTTIFVYDGYPGGAGISERGYHAAERWLRATAERLRDCPCRDGCPSCVVSPKCGNGNEPLDKRAAESLTHTMLDG
ncbi:MAG TPA: DEAD/DEAH box helicase [Actinomycetota bacterium]|jgi:DEAD/DEAH box helicase domain-containing protein|nr:DEAD/DEAH box helicase [Actinomycetota bacterium]